MRSLEMPLFTQHEHFDIELPVAADHEPASQMEFLMTSPDDQTFESDAIRAVQHRRQILKWKIMFSNAAYAESLQWRHFTVNYLAEQHEIGPVRRLTPK
jgi:hypothetical protein